MRALPHAAACAMFLGLASCDDPVGGACTAHFVAYTLTVRDASGAPATGVEVVVTLVRTGEPIQSAPLGPYPPGTYPLIDDGSTGKLQPDGDAVRAVATKGSASVQADFVFDVPGGCHVNRVSGPDTVSLP